VAGAAWEGLVSEALSDGWMEVSSTRNFVRSSRLFGRVIDSLMISRNFGSQPSIRYILSSVELYITRGRPQAILDFSCHISCLESSCETRRHERRALETTS
jgi:hypothetical protein